MERSALQSYISNLSEGFVFPEEETDTQYLEVTVDRLVWHDLALKLRDDEQTRFDLLFCVTGVDWPNHLSVVYHLESTTFRHILVVKVSTENREEAILDTVSDIWSTAELHEREIYDLLGVHFNNHPKMERILLTEDWVGHPLRKDYVDEVNIVLK